MSPHPDQIGGNPPMMTAPRILDYVTVEPFRPFRMNAASGRSFSIRHPEMIAVGRTTVHVFTSMSDDAEEAREREHDVSILLIESIEPLNPTNKQEQHQN
jgi:hypothetical protein